jgi:hypothetical protein
MIDKKPLKTKDNDTMVIEFQAQLTADEIINFTNFYESKFRCNVVVIDERMNLTLIESEE